jgi:hypothetical protein
MVCGPVLAAGGAAVSVQAAPGVRCTAGGGEG